MKLRTQKTNYNIEIDLGGSVTEVTVCPLTSTEVRAIIDRHTKVKYHQGQRQEEIDELGIRLERFTRLLVDWQGVVDANDQPLECNEENKALVADHNYDFVNALFDRADQINQEVNQQQKGDKKN